MNRLSNTVQVTVDLAPVIAPLLQRIEALEKENGILKKGLKTWIKQPEAEEKGFSRSNLYNMRQDGRLKVGVDWKKEGKTIYYNTHTLEKLNEQQEVKRKTLRIAAYPTNDYEKGHSTRQISRH